MVSEQQKKLTTGALKSIGQVQLVGAGLHGMTLGTNIALHKLLAHMEVLALGPCATLLRVELVTNLSQLASIWVRISIVGIVGIVGIVSIASSSSSVGSGAPLVVATP